jgi:glucose-6-phosphate isomerase
MLYTVMNVLNPFADTWRPLKPERRRDALTKTFHLFAGPLGPAIQSTQQQLAASRFPEALWARQPSAWSSDPVVQMKIANRLGWLTSPGLMVSSLSDLQHFAQEIRDDGFHDVVLLGMGGSSLAPEVLRAILGVAPGWPKFHMLDSVDPAAIRAVEISPPRTLFLLASKSGSTIEPNVLAAHFRRQLEDAGVANWAVHFVAITDPRTALHQRAATERFRAMFVNPADIGGRYSALSYFGMVPAALMGLNLAALLGWAGGMMLACGPDGRVSENPGIALGAAIAAAAQAGRDKLTLILPPALKPFGLWVEQLIAESTGKQGRGVIPIAGERLRSAGEYGRDRFFVRLRIREAFDELGRDAAVDSLRTAGMPVAEIDLPEPAALGAEFVRWEIATATAGALLGINPFDEPNVQQAKDATRNLLAGYANDQELPRPAVDCAVGGATLSLSTPARSSLAGNEPDRFLHLLRPGDYFALLAYLGPDPKLAEALTVFRDEVGGRTGCATMFGYGPRYLHSTGQLHKGGPNSGVFLIISATPVEDLPVPGEAFSFAVLELAQALGDFASLEATGRRALFVHLPSPNPVALKDLFAKMLAGLDTLDSGSDVRVRHTTRSHT